MKRFIQTYFILVRMINVTIENYIFFKKNQKQKELLNWKRNWSFLLILLCNSFLFAQTPSISYSGVQSSYNINVPIATLTPTLTGAAPEIRTNVSSLAGSAASGYADGTSASPKYYSPTGITVSAAGNIYIADSQNHCIRKITASGLVSTYAGTGVAGSANGNGNVSQFNVPYAVAVDASENVYVIESTSNAIRKITVAGVVSTFAGSVSTAGFLDGQGAAALFSSPKGLDVDASGNIYVADAANNRIRKITSSGLVTTVAGDGTAGYLDAQGTSSQFKNPTSVAVANSGVIYVSDTSNNRIRAISASGLVTTFAGSGTSGMINGQGTAAQFNAPRALTVDASGTICVVDYSNNRIRKITNTGLVSTLSGTGAFGAVNGLGTSASFKYPEGIAFDASGNVFVADVTNNCIRKIASTGDTSTYSGSAVRGLENGQGGTLAMFNSPVAVAVTSTGIAYAIDDFNSCIRKITTDGIVTTFAGNTATGYTDGQGAAAYFNGPKGLAVDASGTIYVADTYNNRIRKITSSGVVTTIAGDGTAGYLDGQGTAAKFNNPYSLTLDSSGNIYVADTKNHRIRKISTSGAVTTIAGYILSGYADGASTVARFKNPQGIAIDNATGILYIADTSNNRIRKIATDGTVSTFAGSFAGYSDDRGAAAYFNNPIGIAIDASKNLYVGDYYNSVIRKIDPTGLVSTYAGNGSSDYMDGLGNVASFYFPVGVAVNASGTVYVADSYTQRIRKITSVEPFSITPDLPLGLSFNETTGAISGTPTTLNTSTTYTISASNYSGTGTTAITFAIGNTSAPSAPTANPQSFCNSATVGNLVATGSALKWYNVASGGTALASTTALATGTYYVSQTVNSVESSRTQAAVTINIPPVPSASSQTFNNSATVSNLVATGTLLQWYNVASGGSALASTTALLSGTYYVSQTLNGCESSRTSVAVTINLAPSAPTANPQSFCNSATVGNLVATGSALKWYNVASGGTALVSTTALATGTYYVSQTVNSVESSRTQVAVIINITASPSASAQTFNNSATVSNLVATGTLLQWYNVSTGGSALASTTALSSGTYYVSQTLNGCESSRTSVAVTINLAPSAPTANPQSFCNSATVGNLVATGSALKWYNVASGGTALASTTALATGTYYVSQTVNSLESSRTQVAVIINITASPSASAQTFNNSATVSNLVATGTLLQWYNVSTGGSALASTTALSSGTYYVSQTLNGCESSRTSVAVTINLAPSAPTANPQSFCNSATVGNLVATGSALKWYNVASGGTALASTTALTTRTYYVSQTVNSVESSRTSVVVAVNATPAPSASSQSFCSGATVANLVALGTDIKWYTVGSGGTALGSTNALAGGILYVSQTLNGCESPRMIIGVTINTTAAPTASSQSFTNSATVSDLVANGTALKWYDVASGGTALVSTTALATGNYYVSQALNGCESARILVLVTINSVTPAPIASAQSFCNSARVSDLVATGTALKWYTVVAGGTALASTTALVTGNYYVSQTLNSIESSRTIVAVTLNVTPLPVAAAQFFCNSATVANLTATGTSLKWYTALTGGTALIAATGLVTGYFYVSQTLNGCESARAQVWVTVTIAAPPTASAQSFCNGATVADLLANGTSLKWFTDVMGGTELASATVLSSRTYYVSQTVNTCESARTAVSVTVNSTPAPIASAQTFSGFATVLDLVATGSALQWYDVASGGTALPSATALSSGTYYVSQTVNGCESGRTSVVVVVATAPVLPSAPSASDQVFCNGATVSGLSANGTALKWYNVSTGGNALASTALLSSGTYYVSQTVNSVESERTEVAVTVNTTNAPTASAQTFNSGATVANIVAVGTALKWYNVASGGTALALTTSLTSGTYYVSQTLNDCEGVRTVVAVTINSVSGAPTASAQSFCSGATVANLVANGTALKWYTIATGGTALTVSTVLTTRNYYVSQTVNSVESARTLVGVTINTTPAPIVASQSFCSGATVANLAATGTAIRWYNVGTGGTALVSTTNLASGVYYVSQTLNGCESSRMIIGVTVTTTTAPTASAQVFNNAATVANLAASGTALKWYNVATGGTALGASVSLTSGTYYVSQTLNGCESSRRAVAVTINIALAAPAASAQSFCSTASVANLLANGVSLKWYTVATGGTALSSSAVLTSRNYYVSQTVNSVESSRTLVPVTVFAAPTSQTISSPTYSGTSKSTICTSDAKVINVKSGYSADTIQWEVAVMPLNSTTLPSSSAYSKIDGANGSSYSVTNANPGRNYFRAKFVNGGCEETAKYSNVLVVYYSGCGSSTRLSAVTYPNPFTENFKLSMSSSSGEKVNVFIYDLTGRLVEQRETNLEDVSEIELGDRYPSGIFIVNVTQGDDIKTLKVIKR